MVNVFGDKDAILLEVEWSDGPAATSAELTRGALRLWAHGRLIWPSDDSSNGLTWTWIELAEFIARSWRWLLWENGLPFELSGGSINRIQADLDRRWRLLSMAAREIEEEDLYSFEERHDLTRALMGAVAPATWIVREGDMCWVSTREGAALVRRSDVMEVLSAFVEATLARISVIDDARTASLRTSWDARSDAGSAEIIAIATGLEPEVLTQLQGNQDAVSFWELDSRDLIVTELMAAARLAAALPTTDTAQMIEAIRQVPRSETPELNELSNAALTLLPSGPDWYPYDQGYFVADWLRAQLEIRSDDPVDPLSLLKSWGVNVREFKLSTGGVDAIAAWGRKHGPVIIINIAGSHNTSSQGRRATYAHEIAHLLLDRTTALPLAEVMGGRAVGNTEERARAFAAQLLLPKEVAGHFLDASPDPAKAVRALQRRYGVSQEIIAWQARNSDVLLRADVHAILRRYVSQPGRF